MRLLGPEGIRPERNKRKNTSRLIWYNSQMEWLKKQEQPVSEIKPEEKSPVEMPAEIAQPINAGLENSNTISRGKLVSLRHDIDAKIDEEHFKTFRKRADIFIDKLSEYLTLNSQWRAIAVNWKQPEFLRVFNPRYHEWQDMRSSCFKKRDELLREYEVLGTEGKKNGLEIRKFFAEEYGGLDMVEMGFGTRHKEIVTKEDVHNLILELIDTSQLVQEQQRRSMEAKKATLKEEKSRLFPLLKFVRFVHPPRYAKEDNRSKWESNSRMAETNLKSLTEDYRELLKTCERLGISDAELDRQFAEFGFIDRRSLLQDAGADIAA